MTTAEELTYIDPTTAEVLKRDNAVSAYEVPDFQLKERRTTPKRPTTSSPTAASSPTSGTS